MALSLNRIQLLGHVGNDPESPDKAALADGRGVARFSLATNRRYTVRATGERRDETQWHRITCFRNTARFVDQYIRKGTRVYVEGRVEYSEYTKQDGSKGYSTDIIADRVEFVDPRSDQSGQNYAGSGATQQPQQQSAEAQDWNSWGQCRDQRQRSDRRRCRVLARSFYLPHIIALGNFLTACFVGTINQY